jgi:uncharacterized repeat protein (TIGR03837 family)
VIDNFGDAGVCLRLARQLSTEYRWSVRLWIDRLDVLQRWLPEIDLGRSEQTVAGLRVARWVDRDLHPAWELPDLVIEAFGCRLSSSLVNAMARQAPPPQWINLEYLSAEMWIAECHGLPSPDPATGLVKHFFFPSFASCGGLLREKSLSDLVAEFAEPEHQRLFLASLGVDIAPADLPVSLFCYPGSHVDSLVDAWRGGPSRVHCLASLSLAPAVLQNLQQAAADGAIRLSLLPFLGQEDYDRLLLSSAVNFVRGEDSFVRAQWAMRPFVWQPYRQEGDIHAKKLEAFLDRYLEGASSQLAGAARSMHDAWSGFVKLDSTTWSRFVLNMETIQEHNRSWSSQLEAYGDLASHLADFCKSRL